MAQINSKQNIQSALAAFKTGNLSQNAIALFDALDYNTIRQQPFEQKTYAYFKEYYVSDNSNFNAETAKVTQWQSIDLLFQLSKDEISNQHNVFDTHQVGQTIIESYLFFALELKPAAYSRTDLAQITREINKVFSMPVMILFKQGDSITLSVINRRLHKKDAQKDVLEKVTLIKDIAIKNPHRAHIDILFDLSFTEIKRIYKVSNFIELHNAWQKVLDTKQLNKKFYKELSNWYFWAIKEVVFPIASFDADDLFNETQNDKVREHNAKNLIRLLTRILFVWFIKEKDLIPDELFDENYIKTHLIKDFDPHKEKNYNTATQRSEYYRAILQNLFFATLNQTHGQRKFRNRGQNMNVTNLMRYESYFKDPQAFLKLVEDKVPFMNGGLFECLDKPDPQLKGRQGGDVILYEDGFSDRPDNLLRVPDYIFFDGDQHADLSDELGDKKQKDVPVKGLINILKAYKFTVTENTPIEEDIALDPELLGQVFENLLASYNPETKTTARKQTGSFYTPREIVDYMVDESLIAYLTDGVQRALPVATKAVDPATGKARCTPDKLRVLLTYNDLPNPFNETETTQLINAIDTCKILDPACGSGAFPMGILHKLVHCLHKLDPDNKQWQALQRAKILQDTQAAMGIEDNKELSDKLKELNNTFDKNVNHPDYARKLFLIENCIYGVDIQPIAIQISKLRFFISLVVDQIVNPDKKNFGILPLPNLETKFVAANTLIGIDKPQAQTSVFTNPDVNTLEEQLKDVRHRLFSAKTPATKRKLREEDKSLREKMGDLLTDSGWDNNTARQLATWDPYDQNTGSPFFDAEWMFGLSEGFDVVIGNPPYIQIQKFSGQAIQKQWQSQNYSTFEKTGDIYALFIEKGVSLLNQNGLLTFITSNKWMRAGYGKSLRLFLAEKTQPLKLIDFGDSQLFENATTYTDILITRNAQTEVCTPEATKIGVQTLVCTEVFHACTIQNDFTFKAPLADYFAAHSQIMPLMSHDVWVIASTVEQHIKAKIEAKGTPLKDWDININYGIKTGFNEAFIIDSATKERLCLEDPKSVKIIKPILRGRDIKRYSAEWAGLWLINAHNNPPVNINDYPAIKKHLDAYYPQLEKRLDKGITPYNLRNCAYLQKFELEKIVWLEMSPSSNFTIDFDDSIVLNTAYILVGESIKYILSILNSKVVDFYFLTIATEVRGGTRRYIKQYVEQIPIPKISPEQQQPFIELVDKILTLKKQNPAADTKILEAQIDILVYALYGLTKEEIAIVEGKK